MTEQEAETLRIAVEAMREVSDALLAAHEAVGRAAERMNEYLELQGKEHQ